MNWVSLGSMQASSRLMCAAFYKKSSKEKCSCATHGPWTCIPQVMISFLWGTCLGTPRTVTQKRLKVRDYLLETKCRDITPHWQFALHCKLQHPAFCCGTQSFSFFYFKVFFMRLHHIFPLCSDVRVSLHSDYLFRLKSFQTLMTVYSLKEKKNILNNSHIIIHN